MFYSEQAQAARTRAELMVHDGVRSVMLRVAALWDLMAQRCLVTDALRVAFDQTTPEGHAGNETR
jgi:hypothetical protein